MLVLMADKSKANPGRYDYIKHLLRKCPGTVTHFEIAGTSHSFATGSGKRAALDHIENWLMAHVPPQENLITSLNAPRPVASIEVPAAR
jgi:hypothetical protein